MDRSPGSHFLQSLSSPRPLRDGSSAWSDPASARLFFPSNPFVLLHPLLQREPAMEPEAPKTKNPKPLRIQCPECKGAGFVRSMRCRACKGSGKVDAE